MESCTTLSNGGINGQDATSKGRQAVTIQPRPKYRSLRWVAAFGQQTTDLQFLDGDC